MSFRFVFSYPPWFLILCIILGFLYTAILYYRNNKNDFSRKLLYILSILRFLAVTIIAFLLLSPMIEKNISNEEKPVIIIAQDNSSSIIIGKDSTYYKNEYPKRLHELIDKLKKSYEVKTYSFGDQIRNNIPFSFTDKQTDFQLLFDELLIRYTNRNVGAVIIASDGLYNKGMNPVYAADNLSFPIYTIALGDTTVQKDLYISKVNHNRLVYLGNFFPVELNIEATKCGGQTTRLTVSKGKDVLYTQDINIGSNSYAKTIIVNLEAKQTGTQRYHIAINPLKDEITLTNNYRDIYVEVIDKKQKILILANAPHPDIAAIEQSIYANENYEVETALINDFNKPLNNYNLVILHQLPSNQYFNHPILKSIVNSNIPVLYIIGEQSNVVALNGLKIGLNTPFSKQNYNEALPVLNSNFSLFTINDNIKNLISKLPPLSSANGDYSVSGSSEILLYQKIGNVTTKRPLLMFNQLIDKKVGILIGEGYWKWRLMNYAMDDNHLSIDELTNKIVQYLSAKVDKRPFRILSKISYPENEPVELNAELYNESNELVNQPEVEITIINNENKRFPFIFSKTSNAYSLNAGNFPVGEYKYEAKVKLGGKTYNEKGGFTVSELKVEYIQSVADHQLLYLLAHKHDGELLFPKQMNTLPDILKKREDVKPIVYHQTKLTDLINLIWIFVFILILLTTEWFLRKRSGNY
jgi:hypothetical protein